MGHPVDAKITWNS